MSIKEIKENSSKARFNFGFAFIIILGVLLIFISISTTKKVNQEKAKNDPKESNFGYTIISPPIPKKMNLAGERVPLNNFEVKERIDREFIVNTYWHSSTILALKRANRWFPVIEPILKKNNIPDDFKYIAVIESNLENVISPAGAVGFWQITDDIAKKYGLEVDDEVDERYNVEKSTEAACAYFLDAHEQFKTWTLAAAAYNMGTNGLERQIERQKVHNYYNLLLSEETLRYIARIVVMKEIMTHPHDYGFYINKDDLYPPLKTYKIEINSSVKNWADFALNRDITYKILKYFNPWLRDTTLTDKTGKEYLIKMPDKGTLEPVREN